MRSDSRGMDGFGFPVRRPSFKMLAAVSVLLLSLSCFVTLCDSAEADASVSASGTWGDLNWELDDLGVLSITGEGKMKDLEDITDAWRPYRESIKSVTIAEGVTSIGSNAFNECYSMISVKIPSGVSSIGESAFAYCYVMSYCDVPSTVKSIGPSAFYECHNISAMNIPEGVTSIEEGTFMYCWNLTLVSIPPTVKSVGEYAFYGCEKLASINFPASVKSLADYSFFGCDTLRFLRIPATLTSIGTGVFTGCDSVEYIWVDGSNPNYLSDGDVLFDKSKKVLIQYPAGKPTDKYAVPDGVKTIGDYAFQDCIIGTITLPSSLTVIGDHAFYSCASLKTITIPKGVKDIGDGPFGGCGSLESISVEDGNKSYLSEDGVLFDATKTTLVQYPAAKSSKSYEIPATVEIIGDSAFRGAASLGSVAIHDGIKVVDKCAFQGCKSLETVSLPAGLLQVGLQAFDQCQSLISITVDEDNENYRTVDGVLFTESMEVLFQYPLGKAARTYEVPEGVTLIANSAFARCMSLESITFPATLTDIDTQAFARCSSLKSITFPDNLEFVDYDSFEGLIFYDTDATTVLGMYASNLNDSTFTGSGSKLVKRVLYTVAFDSNGGSAVESQTVFNGDKVIKPADPEKKDCSFGGWYSDKDLSAPYDFSAPVQGDMMLYAKWTVKESDSMIIYVVIAAVIAIIAVAGAVLYKMRRK